MNPQTLPKALVALVVLLTASTAGYAQWSMVDGARAHPDYRGTVPKKADVVFSARGKKPEAFAVAKSFESTRVEWVYTTDADFAGQLKREVGWFGGALNSITKLPSEAGMAKDFDGNSIVNPRMKAWNTPWNTTTHPDTQKALQAQTRRYLEMGADSIQVDDPLLQLYAAYLWGGDFNPSTLAGFPKFLDAYPDKTELKRVGLADFRGDYREFLKSSAGIKDAKDYARRQSNLPTTPVWLSYLRATVIDHFSGLRQLMKQTRGAEVPLSMNLTFLDRPSEDNRHFFLAGLADYAMSETPIDSSLELQMRAETARSLGIGFVPSIKPKATGDNRAAIATLYALGANPIVPWDVYVGNDAAGQPKRMFGGTDEYGDLYHYVRQHPGLFNDREQAAVVGIVVPVNRYDDKATMAAVAKLNQRRIPFVFVSIGGTQLKLPGEATHADRLRLLVTVNPDGDFDPNDLKWLRALKVQRVGAGQLTDALLDDLVPFVAVGEAGALKLYPRARTQPGSRDQLVVHLVDESRGTSMRPDAGCKRRIALRRGLLGGQDVEEINWYSGDKKTTLELTGSPREVLVTVPECVLWGTLAVTLKK